MRIAQRDIWICDDCLMVAVNDDSSGIEDDKREQEVQHAVYAYEGLLVPDNFDESDLDQQQYECRACGHIDRTNRCKFDAPHFVHYELPKRAPLCNGCGSDDIELRDGGRKEFSWGACDCCGSDFGGGRTRMALLAHDLPQSEAGKD
jgi:hypothetical protein